MSRDLYEHESEREARQPERRAPVPDIDPCERAPGRAEDRVRQPLERHRISPAERQTLQDIGKFRAVKTDDLQRFRYHGNGRAMRQDLESFRRRGLARSHTVPDGKKRFSVVILTDRGKRLLERDPNADARQAIYAGLVKERELPHDAAIYRMYQAEAASIRASGGTVRRVVLDYELKRRIYAPLAKERPHLKPEEYTKRQAEVAAENGLEVVDGKIPLPDLRIEFETRDGEMAKVDLELATEHYKASQIAEKAGAGFVVYGEGGGSRPEDRDLMTEILSL